MKIYIASDHAGFELKDALSSFLRERSVVVEDLGPAVLDPQDDYPDFIMPMAVKVATDKGSFGIAIGGSGQGEGMAVNRIKGARATVFYGGTIEVLKISREHNDANILALGARFMTNTDAKEAVWVWLNTPFSNDERHVRRITKLDH